ncbi:MAG: penicillin-binding transpeptidase domain-containing protein [Balneolaceae bacterium]
MNERSSILSRLFVVLGLLLLLPAAIVFQLLRINVVEGENLRELWNNQTINYIDIPAERGGIFDMNGTQLASNSVAYRIAVDPHAPGARRDHFRELSQILSIHTGRPASFYLDRIRNAPSRSRYIVLERSIDVLAWEEIMELNARGIILEEEYRRRYGFDHLASHLLGYVNHGLRGMNGLENQYNEILRGQDGLQQVRRDRSNRIFAYVGAPRKRPVQGHSLHTTLNTFIQAIVEEELREGVNRTRSNYGTAIVIEPKTGAIRAMANFPDYNPNSPGSDESANRRNYAVADIVEPGSTFKLVTAIAAIEQGVVDFNEIFETPENGRKVIHGQIMRDHDPLGDVDFTTAIAKSSNIAVSEIAMRLSPDVFYQYARNMGFGTKTSIDLPNEEAGRLQKPYEWSQVTLPWMSIGYEVQATPLQILQAYAAFANDGIMMRPYLVDRITNEFGKTVQLNHPSQVRRIAKKSTIDKLLPVFREVVSDSGTAEWADVEGLDIAGKTGTAQKFIDGRYRTAYRASFVGFFPAEDPKYAVLVMLDEPRTSYYGGFTAGQIFREVTTRIAGLDPSVRYTVPEENEPENEPKLAPSVTGLERSLAKEVLSRLSLPFRTTGRGSVVVSQSPGPGEEIGNGAQILLTLANPAEEHTNEEDDQLVTIPELRGLSMRQAASLLQQSGLNIEWIGSGTIYSQFPQAGEQMREGRTVTVRGRIREFKTTTIASTATH